jgi:DNA repair protein RadC
MTWPRSRSVVAGAAEPSVLLPELAPAVGPRFRERLVADGCDRLTDLELIAVVLGTGVRGRSAMAVAESLLTWTGGLAPLARARPRDLAQVTGVGLARAARLAAAFGLGLRAVLPRHPEPASLIDARDVYERVWPRLAGLAQEVFLVLAIDIRNVVLEEIEVARGSLTQVEVHPREVFRPLIRVGAAGAIAVHNHPSGDPTPSPDDLALTRRLREVGELIGIPLVDHVVVAERGCRSMAEWLATS